jgi:hypothetical protein
MGVAPWLGGAELPNSLSTSPKPELKEFYRLYELNPIKELNA